VSGTISIGRVLFAAHQRFVLRLGLRLGPPLHFADDLAVGRAQCLAEARIPRLSALLGRLDASSAA
jgi:hypothetical protein